MKKVISAILLSAMICGTLVSCGGGASSSETQPATEAATTEAATAAETTEAEAETTAADSTEAEDVPVAIADDVEFEDAVAAQDGDAYLAIVDGQWYVQYWGKDSDLLTYDAGVVPITGNGDYTVSVNADTNGFRYDVTGDANGEYVPAGLEFMSVMIKGGEEKFPGAIITINSITIDGTEVPMTAKNYTSSDDAIETRSNIYNKYVTKPSGDARTPDGNLFDENGNEVGPVSEYSPQIVDPAAFNNGWTKVEVNFTVSGIGEGGDGAESAEETSAAE